MKYPLALTAAAALFGAMTISPASAHPAERVHDNFYGPGWANSGFEEIHHVHGKRFGPRRIARRLRKRGFHDVRIGFVGPRVVVARAKGRRGTVRLVVNRRNGQVIYRELIRPHRAYRPVERRKHLPYQRDHRRYEGRDRSVTWSFGFGF
ncbi:MAG: hypothetical protein AAGI92_11560 [Pseudomonadota bacterium]